jgi:hypothetical protein
MSCVYSQFLLYVVSTQSVGRLESSFRFLRQIVVRSLYDENEMNKYSSGLVCLPVYVIQFEKRWTDLGEIWCGSYATGY